MPRYKHKRLMVADQKEFITWLDLCNNERHKALITIMYYWGIRVSEAITLKPSNLYSDKEKIYLKIKRLKRSKTTDDIPIDINLPGMDSLLSQLSITQEDDYIIPISRVQAWRVCKAFGIYPHFFRLSRFTKIADKYGLVFLINFGGIGAKTANNYIGKSKLRKMEID